MTVLEPVMGFLMAHNRKKVDLATVMAGSDRPRRPVLRVMDRLAKEGYVEEICDNKIAPKYGECGRDRRNPTWLITQKPLAKRPVFKAPKKRAIRDRIWAIIRMKRRFTRNDIETISGISRGSIEDFTQLLETNGVIRQIGKDAQSKVYLLVRDCGVQRPLFKNGDKRGGRL